MKRSHINSIIQGAERFLESQQFFLPPFAHWTLEHWQHANTFEIRKAGLGWAVTDFGFGNHAEHGATVFTLRNAALVGSVYSEKIIVLEAGQTIGHHYHLEKTEDVINRSGGILEIQICSIDANNQLGTQPVRLARDGMWQEINSGSVLRLESGESVTLLPRTSHLFFAPEKTVLMGEVSSVNDDQTDNYFVYGTQEDILEEDATPYRLLTRDYLTLQT